MNLRELIEELKDSLTPEEYARHKQELDDLAFRIDVENQDSSVRNQENKRG